MQIVIDIPEEDYKAIKNMSVVGDMTIPNVFDAVRNGIPLPKGTKRIVDADKLYYKKMYFEGSYKSDVVVFAKDIDKKSIMI